MVAGRLLRFPDFSTSSLQRMLDDYEDHAGSLRRILRGSEPERWGREQQVDAALVAAHLERVRWEQTVLRAPHRNPDFYVTQTLGAVQEVLVGAEPLSSGGDTRLVELLIRLSAVPTVLEQAQTNLAAEAEGEFATIALSNLEGRGGCCREVVEAIAACVGAWPAGQ